MGKLIFLTLNNITNSKTPAPWKECIHPRYELLVNAGSHFQTPASKSPKTVSPICKAELSLLFLLILLLRFYGSTILWFSFIFLLYFARRHPQPVCVTQLVKEIYLFQIQLFISRSNHSKYSFPLQKIKYMHVSTVSHTHTSLQFLQQVDLPANVTVVVDLA